MGRRISPEAVAKSRERQEQSMNANRVAVYQAIAAAGERGITKVAIAKATGICPATVQSRLDELRAPEKRIYVVDWPMVGGRQTPTYAVGDAPDAVMVPYVKKKPDPYANTEALARRDAEKKHREWKDGWEPHCDVAAAWMVGRAV